MPVSLLTILLSQANRPISVERLVSMLWEAEPPRSAVPNLRTYIRTLRTAMGGLPVRLDREAGGYLLRVADADCDHLRFAALVASTGDDPPRLKIERLEQALALWRGAEAAEGVARHGPLGGWLETLDEQRMRAVERVAEARIAVGAPDQAIRELSELVAVAPLRSHGWWLKMLAHHRLGEHDRALAVYRQAAAVFRDELGIEPDPQLTELYRALLEWDPAAGGSLGGVERRLTMAGEPHRIVHRTPEPPPLVGRDDPLAAIRDGSGAVPGPRIVVVYGPPGVGTSAVALRAAHDLAAAYPDGQLHLDLRAWPAWRRASGEPVRAALRMLGVTGPPGDVHEASDLLRAVTAGRRLLFVLDNASAAGEVRPLLSLDGACGALVTCWYPLGAIAATGRVALRRLTVAESAEVLRRLLGRDRGTEEFEHLALLCGGLPLALRIVAARLIDQPTLTPARLIARLRDERTALAELETDDLSLRVRLHEVLASVSAAAQRVFARLGGAGVVSLAEAARRAGAPEAVAETLLDELVRAHLMFAAGGRYRVPRFGRLLAAELVSGSRVPVLMGPSSA